MQAGSGSPGAQKRTYSKVTESAAPQGGFPFSPPQQSLKAGAKSGWIGQALQARAKPGGTWAVADAKGGRVKLGGLVARGQGGQTVPASFPLRGLAARSQAGRVGPPVESLASALGTRVGDGRGAGGTGMHQSALSRGRVTKPGAARWLASRVGEVGEAHARAPKNGASRSTPEAPPQRGASSSTKDLRKLTRMGAWTGISGGAALPGRRTPAGVGAISRALSPSPITTDGTKTSLVVGEAKARDFTGVWQDGAVQPQASPESVAGATSRSGRPDHAGKPSRGLAHGKISGRGAYTDALSRMGVPGQVRPGVGRLAGGDATSSRATGSSRRGSRSALASAARNAAAAALDLKRAEEDVSGGRRVLSSAQSFVSWRERRFQRAYQALLAVAADPNSSEDVRERALALALIRKRSLQSALVSTDSQIDGVPVALLDGLARSVPCAPLCAERNSA